MGENSGVLPSRSYVALAGLAADPGPGFAAANGTDASFDPKTGRSLHRDFALIISAVIGVIDQACPGTGACRAHAIEQRQTDHRTRCQSWIGILVIDLGFAGLRIDRIAQADDLASERRAARTDPDLCVSFFSLPNTCCCGGILGLCRWNRANAGKTDGKTKEKAKTGEFRSHIGPLTKGQRGAGCHATEVDQSIFGIIYRHYVTPCCALFNPGRRVIAVFQQDSSKNNSGRGCCAKQRPTPYGQSFRVQVSGSWRTQFQTF